ncbi:AMP-dependent synthetase/ligase [Penicillium angulare]|uniref:AMP-dependent synthetase/ligase n=1 Tax=Penicillium angulare TaxID=116970 RepID=UPI002540BA2A|nr:AMP-dependent synthetase/ligase [Penicillium angulare]KAJ5287891.1 AMP-dependent synthetase/ligase [Penicillium angulare]
MPLPFLPDIPLSLALPAAATALAYLNAKHSVFYDAKFIAAAAKMSVRTRVAERKDHLNIFYVLEQNALSPKTANHEFIVYNGQSWTFHEAYITVLRFGNWFKNVHNVKSREIVALDCMNSSSFVFMILGLWSIGASPALINFNLTNKPLAHSLKVSTARLVIVDDEIREHFTPELLETFASSEFRDGKGPLQVEYLTVDLEAQIIKEEPVRQDDKERAGALQRDMAFLIYTSGTTGLPKPAIVSWQKCWISVIFVGHWMGLTSQDRFYTCMPLYHSSAAMLAFVNCIQCASTLVIGRRFSARNFMSEARDTNATIIQYVGETLRYILATPPNIDPATGEDLDKKHNIRLAFGNGLRPDIWNRFKQRFNIPTIAEFYAATEGTNGSWNLSSNDFSAGAIGRNGTIGNLILNRHVTVVDVDWETQEPWRHPKTGLCRKTPRGDPGELLLVLDSSDPNASFQGYFKNPEATEKKILRNVLVKGDAYFRTGDMVRWDKEGRWYFSDRLGDTFRWKSENVSTSEVSEVMGAHPAVHEANVYGVALPNHDGRAGCAALITSDQLASGQLTGLALEPSRTTLDDIAAHTLKNLPRYAAPIFLRVMPEMPATGNMKQQKQDLRTQGVDPEQISKDHRIYWLQGSTYVPFEHRDWDRLNGGQVRL